MRLLRPQQQPLWTPQRQIQQRSGSDWWWNRGSSAVPITFVGADTSTDVTPNFTANAGSENRLYIMAFISPFGNSTIPDLPSGWTSIGTDAYSGQLGTRVCYIVSNSSTVPAPSLTSGGGTVARVAWSIYAGGFGTPGTVVFDQTAVSSPYTIDHPAVSGASTSWYVGGHFYRNVFTSVARASFTDRASGLEAGAGHTLIGDTDGVHGGVLAAEQTTGSGGTGTPITCWAAEIPVA